MSEGNSDNPIPATESGAAKQAKGKEGAPTGGGFLANLAFNIIIPVFILSRLSGVDSLGPSLSIVFALAFPIGYGLWDLRQSGKVIPFRQAGTRRAAA